MKIESFQDLRVYQSSINAAMNLFELSAEFPAAEKYSMTDQIRRSSRSVCANIAEAWRKRRYKASFISKLNDAETEAAETQVWIELAYLCKYISKDYYSTCFDQYEQIIRQLVTMINQVNNWIINKSDKN